MPEIVRDLPQGGRRLVQKAHGYVATFVSGQAVPSETIQSLIVRDFFEPLHLQVVAALAHPWMSRAAQKAAKANILTPIDRSSGRWRSRGGIEANRAP